MVVFEPSLLDCREVFDCNVANVLLTSALAFFIITRPNASASLSPKSSSYFKWAIPILFSVYFRLFNHYNCCYKYM